MTTERADEQPKPIFIEHTDAKGGKTMTAIYLPTWALTLLRLHGTFAATPMQEKTSKGIAYGYGITEKLEKLKEVAEAAVVLCKCPYRRGCGVLEQPTENADWHRLVSALYAAGYEFEVLT